MGRHVRLQFWSGSRADEAARFIGKQLSDFLSIVAPCRLPSNNNRPGIDILSCQSCFLKRGIHELLERLRLDVPIAAKRREQNPRARNHPALQYHRPPLMQGWMAVKQLE